MELIKFCDTCRISREIGRYDDYDNPVLQIAYEGPCLYEERSYTNSDRIIARYPLLFLPTNDAVIYTDDFVSVTTFKGRVIKGRAASVRDIPLRKENITRIEIKQAAEELP